MLKTKNATRTVGHVARSGLGGCAGIATRPRSFLVAVPTGDAASRPVAPVSLSVHVVWDRREGKTGC